MLKIEARCPQPDHIDETLILPYDQRQKSRLRTTLASGEEVGISLERGSVLRDGDYLLASDGRVIHVVAAPESVMTVTCDTPEQLARAAYHLGNRHLPVQVGNGWLRLMHDHVYRQMLEGLGATVTEEHAPFEPESGAYGDHGHAGGHTHEADDHHHGGVIHQYHTHSHTV